MRADLKHAKKKICCKNAKRCERQTPARSSFTVVQLCDDTHDVRLAIQTTKSFPRSPVVLIQAGVQVLEDLEPRLGPFPHALT